MIGFLTPMLAKGWPKKFDIRPNEWVAEEKYDGVRLIVEVDGEKRDLFGQKAITAWSRNGNQWSLPQRILNTLNQFPNGVYDGELIVPGKRSYGVVELDNFDLREFVIFDLLHLMGVDLTMNIPYKYRRGVLGQIFLKQFDGKDGPGVQMAVAWSLNSVQDAYARFSEVLERDGEGLILKHVDGFYIPGIRSKHFIKLKDLKAAVLRVVGFKPSTGGIVNRGPYAITVLRDEDGNETTVKTLNDETCRKLEKVMGDRSPKFIDQICVNHPWVGRELRIEYQERTPDGGYRHPRWDRWEDE